MMTASRPGSAAAAPTCPRTAPVQPGWPFAADAKPYPVRMTAHPDAWREGCACWYPCTASLRMARQRGVNTAVTSSGTGIGRLDDRVDDAWEARVQVLAAQGQVAAPAVDPGV